MAEADAELNGLLDQIKASRRLSRFGSRSEGQMKCTIEECSGGYELRSIAHTVRQKGEVIVVDHVPAEVCTVCGDVLLNPDTVRRIEALLQSRPRAAKTAPVYEFA